MSSQVSVSDVVDDPGLSTTTVADSRGVAHFPWVTAVSISICVVVCFALNLKNIGQNPDAMVVYGWLPALEIWRGHFWALVTSAFVHMEIWHLALNMYWLWILGKLLEPVMGSLRYLAFLVMAAFLSSSYQMVISDTTGIGMSGVVYAIFGFMWLSRSRYPEFNQVMTRQNIQLFLYWLVGCIIATHLKIWTVGNAAHVAGLLFGAGVAGAFALSYRPRLAFFALTLFVLGSIPPLLWCPWSVTWLSLKAYDAHLAEHVDEAIYWYTRIVQRDPGNACAYLNRGNLYQATNRDHLARRDFERARELDPKMIAEQPKP
jgi:GlpG protein